MQKKMKKWQQVFTYDITSFIHYQDMWEIPRETLQFKKKLGSGQFGDVWEGENNRPTAYLLLSSFME